MGLKIIAGEFRGRNLFTLPGLSTRPTANRMREALFNILAFKVQNAVVLDLFAGSGALGLEALSRGAASVTLVDNNRNACAVIAKNMALCNTGARARLTCRAVEQFKDFDTQYSLVLMDPPYGKGLTDTALKLLAANVMLAPNAIIAAEHETGITPKYDDSVYTLTQTRVYGAGAISFLEYNNPVEV